YHIKVSFSVTFNMAQRYFSEYLSVTFNSAQFEASLPLTSSQRFLLLLLYGQAGFGLLNYFRKSRLIKYSNISQNLAVHFNRGFPQTVHENAVG
ncbi:hypothetical protein SAMN05216315_13045, partial [Nitrosospira sp. Nsp18]